MVKSVSEYVITYLKNFVDESGANIDTIFTDILEGDPTNMALASSSSTVVKRYFYGDRKIERNFSLFLLEYSGANIERKQNTAFVEKLEDWVNMQNNNAILPYLGKNRVCTFIEAANGMLYEIDQDNKGTYLIQLKLIYIERRNENGQR